jgi:hypothetical protein
VAIQLSQARAQCRVVAIGLENSHDQSASSEPWRNTEIVEQRTPKQAPLGEAGNRDGEYATGGRIRMLIEYKRSVSYIIIAE